MEKHVWSGARRQESFTIKVLSRHFPGISHYFIEKRCLALDALTIIAAVIFPVYFLAHIGFLIGSWQKKRRAEPHCETNDNALKKGFGLYLPEDRLKHYNTGDKKTDTPDIGIGPYYFS